MIRNMLIAAALFAFAAAAEAQPEARVPHGKWWRRPAVSANLQLTKEQQQRLDEVWTRSQHALIDAKAEVRKAQVALRTELDRPKVVREEVQRATAQVSNARARLFDLEVMMLVDMRSVLEPHQWERLQERQAPKYQPPRLGRRPR